MLHAKQAPCVTVSTWPFVCHHRGPNVQELQPKRSYIPPIPTIHIKSIQKPRNTAAYFVCIINCMVCINHWCTSFEVYSSHLSLAPPGMSTFQHQLHHVMSKVVTTKLQGFGGIFQYLGDKPGHSLGAVPMGSKQHLNPLR